MLKVGDYDSIKFMIESAMKSGQDKNIGHEYLKDVESRYREDNRKTIPTPWDKINEDINSNKYEIIRIFILLLFIVIIKNNFFFLLHFYIL